MSELPPNAIVFNILQGEWVSLCLKAVVILRIPDIMEDTPQSPEQLAKKAGVDANNLHIVMRVLAANGIFNEHVEEGLYSHNRVSKDLVTGVRGNSCSIVKMMAHESHQRPWQPESLVECIKTGKDGFRTVFPGEDFWSYMDKRPSERALFWDTMESTSTLWHSAILDHYDFSSIKSLVDVGGGYGTLLRRIMLKYPHLHGILFDLPHVIEKATIKEEKEIQDRLEVIGGSFFEQVPPGVDAYISTTVLHDWNDHKAGEILDVIHKAAHPGAKLLLGETVVPEESRTSASKVMSAHMMTIVDGKERTAKEWTELLAKHGFKVLRFVCTIRETDSHVIEAERV